MINNNINEVLVCWRHSVLNNSMKHAHAIKFDYVKILAML